MALNQHAATLVDITVKAFNGDVTSLSPTDGLSLIDSWLNFLQADGQHASAIVSGLSDLKAELQSGNFDNTSIQRILKDLTEQIKQITNSAETENKPVLKTLSEALQGFSQQTSGESGQAATTGGQAPITSTVGGESTNRGTGISSLNSNDDDLSDRNGGTISSSPTIDMNDTTGSDGGSAEERFSDESDGNNDSGYSTDSKRSRSDSARVDGMGVSGGTGDANSSQSGGRSQY